MKIPPHREGGAKKPTLDEIKGLERALNKTYARLRERARAEWLRHQGEKIDPADAKVSVRITAESKPVPLSAKSETASRRLLPKPRKRRRKLILAKAGRPRVRRGTSA